MEGILKNSKENINKSNPKLFQMFNQVCRWMGSRKEEGVNMDQQLNEQSDENQYDDYNEDQHKEISKSGYQLEEFKDKDDKSILKELFEMADPACADFNFSSSNKRKTRKDFATRNSLKQNYNYRVTLSASPVCKNRRQDEDENTSDSNEGAEEGDLGNLNCKYSYENTPQDFIDNEIDEESQTETAPTAPTYDEE